MIDEDEVLDPGQNFTQDQAQSFGASFPAFAFRQMIGAALRQIRKDTVGGPDRWLENFLRRLPRKTIDQVKAFFRDHPNIYVEVNYPSADAHLPLVCVVTKSENEAAAYLGDRVNSVVRSMLEQHLVEVVIGTQDSNLTYVLHAIVKRIFAVNKSLLSEGFDVHNMVLTGRDLVMDAAVLPQMGYYKTLVVSFQTSFDFVPDGLEDATSPVRVDLGLIVDAPIDGLPGLTEVPGND